MHISDGYSQYMLRFNFTKGDSSSLDLLRSHIIGDSF